MVQVQIPPVTVQFGGTLPLMPVILVQKGHDPDPDHQMAAETGVLPATPELTIHPVERAVQKVCDPDHQLHVTEAVEAILLRIDATMTSGDVHGVAIDLGELAGMLSCTGFLADLITNAGGISLIRRCLSVGLGDPAVVEYGTASLAALSADRPNAVVEAEGVDAIVAGMTQWSSSGIIQRHGATALQRIALSCDASSESVVAAGGVLAVTSAMSAHPHDAHVQRRGIGALTGVSQNGGAHTACVVAAGGVQAVVCAMNSPLFRTEIKNPGREVVCAMNSPDVTNILDAANFTLCHIAAHGFSREIAQAGGIDAIIQGMQRSADQAYILCSSVYALR